MIPERLRSYQALDSIFTDANDWLLLREWSLSEVYRITLPQGERRIVKWGGREMAKEAVIYQQLLKPLKLRVPHLFASYSGEDSAVLIMEDVGENNLEQHPEKSLFLEAARELARFRQQAAEELDKGVPESTIDMYTISTVDVLLLLEELLSTDSLALHPVLLELQARLPSELRLLQQQTPLTLIHHDYHAKNLVIQGNRLMPIDWSGAYLGYHLGDLYCLMSEAKNWSNVSSADILLAFYEETDGRLTLEMVRSQVVTGGICWLIKTIHWLVYGGTDIIPGSKDWIPHLLIDLGELAQSLQNNKLA